MAVTKIDDRGLNTPIDLLDNEKIRFGTGNDVEIYHDGSESHIKNNTGALIISTVNGNAWIKYNSDNMAKFSGDAEVALYYDNVKKLETISAGASVTGHLGVGTTSPNKSSVDAAISVNGSGTSIVELCTGDARKGNIYTDGTDLYMTNNSTGWLGLHVKNTELAIKAIPDGAVELYHNALKKFETASNGISIPINAAQDGIRLTASGAHYAALYADVNRTGSDENLLNIRADWDGTSVAQILFKTGADTTNKDDGAIQFRTASAGSLVNSLRITNNGNLTLPDSKQFKFGAGEDLQIWHDSTNSNNKIQFDQQLLFRSHGSGGTYENSAAFNPNGSVDLYYNDVKKFQTESDGIRILGDSKIWFDAWQGRFDRNWDDYPSITITPSTTYGNQGEFRVHGQSGSLGGYGSGADFSIDFRVDGAYQTGSDRRRKSNIEEITGALATVKQLTGKKFNIINRQGELDPNKDTKKQFGLIAQECEDIIPEVITFHPKENTPNENGWCSAYGLDYGQLTPLLINAIKELSAKVEALETEVATLKAK